jgi:hypothetical protein
MALPIVTLIPAAQSIADVAWYVVLGIQAATCIFTAVVIAHALIA